MMKGRDMMRRYGLGVFFAVFLMCWLSAGTSWALVQPDQGAEQEYHPTRILLKFHHPPSGRFFRTLKRFFQLNQIEVIPRIQLHIMNYRGSLALKVVLKRLNQLDVVDYAEPDFVRTAAFIPNDPRYPGQWGLIKVGVEQYWDFEPGDFNVVAAVVDSGIDLDHPDLQNKLWVNPGEIPGNKKDDDGNGYVDDINGFDFAGNALYSLPGNQDSVPNDQNGHGTHVAGRIAAETGNGIGVAGMAPGVSLMVVKVLGRNGSGFASDVVKGILYAANNGAHVINLSLGGASSSLSEFNALKTANDANVFINAASGNEGDGRNRLLYPAAYSFAMGVGATDSGDNIGSFSNSGPQVEVTAPGVKTLSTVRGGGYASSGWTGTSMASPHAAGMASLLYSAFPNIANWQVRLMLREGTKDLGASGWDPFYGFGRLDAPTLLNVNLPSGQVEHLLWPVEGSTLPGTGKFLSFLWSPVGGAVKYKVTVLLPDQSTLKITVNDTFLRVGNKDYNNAPSGNYLWTVDALNTQGNIISSTTGSFLKN